MGSIDIDKSPSPDDLIDTPDTTESVVENAAPAPELTREISEEVTTEVAQDVVENTTDPTSDTPESTTEPDKDIPAMTLSEKVAKPIAKPIPASEPNGATKPTEEPTFAKPVDPIKAEINARKAEKDEDESEEDLIDYTKASVFANLEENPNRLKPGGQWPPPIFFDSLNASDQERFYLEHRWYAQWSYYDQKATQAKTIYQRLQLIIGIGSVTVPVLVGLNASNEVARNSLQLITVAISLMVAASAAIESVKTYGDNWRTFRGAAEELNREKSLYDAHAGPYRRAKSRFLTFVERCEDIIAKQNGAWIAFKDESKDKDEDGDGIPDGQSGTVGNG
ncbi:MAG: DUF4231 domain-containing protein [Aggregatilineales bacterium]